MKFRKSVLKFSNVLIYLSWASFEIFNYLTTKEAFLSILGLEGWAVGLSVGMCFSDVGALGEAFTNSSGDDDGEQLGFRLLWVLWFVAAIGNAFLTWFAVRSDMLSREGEMASAVLGETALNAVAIAIAVLVLLVRIFIMRAVSQMVSRPKVSPPRPKSPAKPQRVSEPTSGSDVLQSILREYRN